MARRRTAMTLVGVVILASACAATSNGTTAEKAESPAVQAAPTNAAGIEQWDLRKRPTAAQVGMGSRDFVAYETPDEPRTIEVLLPGGKTLRVEDVTLVTFDRITSSPADAGTEDPTQMDVRVKPQPLDGAEQLMREALTTFGADPEEAAAWRARVDARPTSGTEADQRIEGGGNADLGYLDIGVGGVFDPVNETDTAIVKFHVNFTG